MGEELERGHHFVVGVFVMEGDVMYLLEDVEDEERSYVLGGTYAVLVIDAGVPKRLEFFCSHALVSLVTAGSYSSSGVFSSSKDAVTPS